MQATASNSTPAAMAAGVAATGAGFAAGGGETTAPDAFAALLELLSAPQQSPPPLAGAPAGQLEAAGAHQELGPDGSGSSALPEPALPSIAASPFVLQPEAAPLDMEALAAPAQAATAGAAANAPAAALAPGDETMAALTEGPDFPTRDTTATVLLASPRAAPAAHAAQPTGGREASLGRDQPPAEQLESDGGPAAAGPAVQPAAMLRSLEISVAAAEHTPPPGAPAPGTGQPAALQPAGLVVTPSGRANAAPLHEAALPSRPYDTAFAGDLAAQVRLMVGSGLQRAELRLNPSDLGPIHIQLSVNSQTADISFAATHGATRDGIAQALPALRDMLASQGLSLGQAGVSSQHPGQPSGDDRQLGYASHGPSGSDSGTGTCAPAGPVAVSIGQGRGMLDLYA